MYVCKYYICKFFFFCGLDLCCLALVLTLFFFICIVCPVCVYDHFRKESRGGGRQIVGGEDSVEQKNVQVSKNSRQEEWTKVCNQFTSCNECISDWKCAYCIGDAKCVFDEQGSCKTAEDHVGRNGLDSVKCPLV